MKVTTTPAGHFGWEGQTLEYTVKVDGATTVSAPATATEGLKVRVLETRPAGNGVEARVAVDVVSPVFY
jgi:hypothetical protein